VLDYITGDFFSQTHPVTLKMFTVLCVLLIAEKTEFISAAFEKLNGDVSAWGVSLQIRQVQEKKRIKTGKSFFFHKNDKKAAFS
jgi:hypothetical protein